MDLPFINTLPDRRMLLTLVRQDVVRFPDVQERSEARLHVVEIVLACLRLPGGLPALYAALETMAPYADGTRRARQLIESATLLDLLSGSELERARNLLRTADAALLVEFEKLLREPAGPDGLPPALSFVERTANRVDPQRAVDLRGWVDIQAGRLRVEAALRILRDRLVSETTGELAVDNTLAEGSKSTPGVADSVDRESTHFHMLTPTDPGILGASTDADTPANAIGRSLFLPAEDPSKQGDETLMSPLAPAQ